LPPAARASIRLRFRDGETFCGNDANVIACRTDSELTEFNLRDYRFALSGRATTIGEGPIPVNFPLVLLHEMGHWIGLPHINQRDSIVSESLASARCINQRTIEAVGAVGAPVARRPLAFKLNP
jgi:hypothetical protein